MTCTVGKSLTDTTAEEGEHESQVIDDRLGDSELQSEGQQSKEATMKRKRKLVARKKKNSPVSARSLFLDIPFQ